MKTKSKILIGLMALCLAGATGTTLALTATPATGSINHSIDGAVYFAWDQETIPSIDSLKGGIAQYTSFSASVESTKDVSGTVSISFALSAETKKDGKTAVLTGLTVTVYAVDQIIDSTHSGADLAAAGVQEFALTGSHDSDTAEFEIETDTAKHTTTQAYVLKFLYSGVALGTNEVLDGKITLNSSFTPTAA